MSRAYRIRVSESLSRIIRGEDRVSSQLELLPILPEEEMAALLAAELERRGFAAQDGVLVRQDEGITIEIDPTSGQVTVKSAVAAAWEEEQAGEGFADADTPREHQKNVETRLRERVQADLARKAEAAEKELQKTATEKLEGMLTDVRRELDGAVNRVTGEALKTKAGRIGQIKQVTEDPTSGSLTIVVEV